MSGLPTVVIAGCGAVTSSYYLPALAALRSRVDVIGLYDSEPSRVCELARHFSLARAAESFEALLDMSATIVIVASPPAAHAVQSIAALRSGAHVLCEKPLAPSVGEATAMAAAAAEQDRLLTVNMVRRHFPASRIVEKLVANESLGTLRGVSAFEGGPFRWPIRDQSYFSREISGGGVLIDVGTHMLDLLASWFGEPAFVGYKDDAIGGVETNALIELTFGGAPATIRLSRDWERPNLIELNFERGRVRWCPEQLNGVEVQFEGGPPLWLEDESAGAFDFVGCFTAQIEATLDHLEGNPPRLVTAAQALPTVALVERSYRDRARMAMPWLEPAGKPAHD